MKKLTAAALLLLAAMFTIPTGCKKDEPVSSPANPNTISAERGIHANKLSSEVAVKWMNVQVQILRTITGVSNLALARPFAYSGVVLYESVVPGMPSYQSLAGQLSDLPGMPEVSANLTYDWLSSANAGQARILRLLYPTMGTANLYTVDSLEIALSAQFSAASDAETITRSVEFGRGVAQTVFNWSVTDGQAHLNDPFTVPVGPGLWEPTPPAFNPAPAGPYWRNLRTMVPNSGNNSQPPAPPAYSTVPGSEFYEMVKQVYDVTQPSLTQAQIDQAMYYRDIPGLTSMGHFLNIIRQVVEQQGANLEIAAAAYAITGISIFDASISTWETKFTYNLVRPVTYIRTVLNHPAWSPLFPTPGHPEYSSAHASLSSAAAVALASVFGDNAGFSDHSYDYLGFPARDFATFTDFGIDAGNSRLYAGIHYQNSIDKSLVQGRVVANNIQSTLVLKKP